MRSRRSRIRRKRTIGEEFCYPDCGGTTRRVASFEQAIRLRPDYFQAYNGRGNSLQALGRFAEAVASYDRAIALNADYAIAYANRGNALQALKRYHDAIESYDRAIVA